MTSNFLHQDGFSQESTGRFYPNCLTGIGVCSKSMRTVSWKRYSIETPFLQGCKSFESQEQLLNLLLIPPTISFIVNTECRPSILIIFGTKTHFQKVA